MAMESHPSGERQAPAERGALRRTLLVLSVATMVLGGLAGPLFTRIYFLHGGRRLWLVSLQQSVAFFILFLPLSASYFRRKERTGGEGLFSLTPGGAAACVSLGVIGALNAYMCAYGSAALPVSTSTLLISTQLVFTAVLAFFIVGQQFTAYSVNAVVLMVMGPVVLGLQADRDRPPGESSGSYYLGFLVMVGGAALMGLQTPLVELTCLKMRRTVTHVLVLEMLVLMAVSTTVFCVVAMLINKDFQAIPREAKEYGLGETKYYLVLVASAIFWQLFNAGFVGVISFSSSLLAGIVLAMLVPLGEILPVLVLHEKFTSGKGVAVALCLWGFVSYLYGEYRQYKRLKQTADKGLELTAAP